MLGILRSENDNVRQGLLQSGQPFKSVLSTENFVTLSAKQKLPELPQCCIIFNNQYPVAKTFCIQWNPSLTLSASLIRISSLIGKTAPYYTRLACP